MRFFLMFLLFVALPVAAAPKDDLHIAYVRFLAMKTFKAEIDTTTGKMNAKSSVEFQAPDRYRISNNGQPPNLIIGNTMYMKINGSNMQIPMPGLKDMLAQYRNPDMLKQLEADTAVESLGIENVGNQSAKKYRYTTSKPMVSNNIMWVSTVNGDILQIETTGTMNKKSYRSLIQYSHYNSPAIKISTP